jgi:iron complex outermembrane receptor protein
MRLSRLTQSSGFVLIGLLSSASLAQAQQEPAPAPPEAPPVIPALPSQPEPPAASTQTAAPPAVLAVPAPPDPGGEPAPQPAAPLVKDDELGTIVVTAQRRETNLQNTPIAISVFGPELLESRGVTSIRDLAGQVPNLYISRANISYTTQTYSLRGIGETDPIQEPVVAVYVDDVYQPRQLASMFDFNDIERVEVLRGPQGTLYGRNSSAGALRVITTDPGDELHALGSLTYGELNHTRAIASVSGPLLKRRLWAGVAFLRNRRDGTAWDPTLRRDVNRIDLDAARLKLRWTPSERWDIQATLNGMIDRSDTRSYIPANQLNSADARRISYSEVQPYQHLDQGSSSLRAIFRANEHLELKSISSAGGFDLNPVFYDNDGEAALIQKNLIHYEDGYFTQELQLNGRYAAISFSSGLFYLHERFFVERDGYSRRNGMLTDPALNPENYAFFRAHNVTTTNSIAAFGEASLKLTEWVTLTVGLRETIEAKNFDFDNKTLDLQGNVTAQSILGEADEDWSALTPKLSAAFQWLPTLLQYFTYSRGFKSGGFDNRATLLELAQRPFDPEYVDSFETGIKTDLLGHHLRLNLAAFYNDYRDLQVAYVDPAYPGNSIRGNAGKAHSAGVEYEASARLPVGLSLQASGGYLYAVYDSYKNAGGADVNADGHRLINSPRWSFSEGATYELPLELPGDLRVGADVEWASASYTSALMRRADRIPPQLFLNAALSWLSGDGHTTVTLSSRNLLDTQKPVSTTFNPGTGVHYYNFPDPRLVLATVKYEL